MRILISIFLLIPLATFATNNGFPIIFIKNNGQWPNAELYRLTKNQFQLQIHKSGFKYILSSYDSIANTVSSSIIDVELKNGNEFTQIIEGATSTAKFNFIYENEFNQVPAFSDITIKNVYPNIDLIFKVNNDSPEYDFVVNEGGDPNDIELIYHHCTPTINNKGIVVLKTEIGEIYEHKPLILKEGQNNQLAQHKIVGQSHSFSKISLKAPFVIDPVITWATYDGGSAMDFPYKVKFNNNKIFMVGFTRSANNIGTAGAFQSTLQDTQGFNDGYISCWSTDGVLQWATYYGTALHDEIIKSIDFDNSNNLVVCGEISVNGTNANAGTTTSGFGTAGTFKPTIARSSGWAFLAKFSESGTRVWSTFFGSDVNVSFSAYYHLGLNAISITPNGKIYFTGITKDHLLGTSGTHDASNTAGNFKCFLSCFSSDGNRDWTTYFDAMITLPGGISVFSTCIANDQSGNPIISGVANKTVGTSGTIEPNFIGGVGNSTTPAQDIFVAKFDLTGNLTWATHIGGTLDEYPKAIQVGSDNSIYLAGVTRSSIANMTGGFRVSRKNSIGSDEGLLVKINSNGNSILWSSYYSDRIMDIDLNNNLYVLTYIGVSCLQELYSPGADATGFYTLAEFTTGGARNWGTYIRYATSGDGALTSDNTGNCYISSFIQSTGASTAGAHQTTIGGTGGNGDHYLQKICNQCWTIPTVSISTTAQAGCSTTFLATITNLPLGHFASSYSWKFNGIDAGTLPFLNRTANATDSAQVIIGITVGTCTTPYLIYSEKMAGSNSGIKTPLKDTAVCSYPVTVDASVIGGTYIWPDNSTNSTYTISSPGTYIVQVTQNGCSGNDTVVVTNAILSTKKIIIADTCLSMTTKFSTIGNIKNGSKSWDLDDGQTSLLDSPQFTYPSSGIKNISISFVDECNNTQTLTRQIQIIDGYKTTLIASDDTICSGQSVTFTASYDGLSSHTKFWKVNSTNITNNSFTYTTNSLPIGLDSVVFRVSPSVAPTCPATLKSKVNIVVLPNITISATPITGTKTEYCQGESISLQTLLTNMPNASVIWKVNGANLDTTFVNPHSVTLNTVSNNDVITTEINPNLTCYISNPLNLNGSFIVKYEPPREPTIFLQANSEICIGGTINATATGNYLGSNPIFSWRVNNNEVSLGNNATYNFTGINNGDSLSVNVISNYFCLSSSTKNSNKIGITVIDEIIPSISIESSDTTVCPKETITLNIQSISGQGSSPSYLWYVNGKSNSTSNSLTFTPQKTGDQVFLILTSSEDCANPKSATSNIINYTVYPKPNTDLPEKITFCKEETNGITLQTNINGSYLWNTGETSASIYVTKEGIYTLQITNEYNCTSTDNTNVIINCEPRVFIPSAFTPNQDGINDYVSFYHAYLTYFEIKIFNRWGEIIYTSTDPTINWNGIYSGELIPVGTYPYICTYKGMQNGLEITKTFKGEISRLE